MIVHLLGTGAAVSDAHRSTTMLAVEAAGETGGFVLVDCGGDAVQCLLESGLNPVDIEAVVLTHQHPDHISGFPLLIEKLWLLGRRRPLPVLGPADALDVAERVFACFDTSRWEGLPERDWHPVPMEAAMPLGTWGGLTLTSWPVEHPVPTLGLRFESAGGTVVGYSCDTSPCASVVEIGREADLLVHEASGHLPGVHASAEEAAETARQAGARLLVLVHLPPKTSEAGLGKAREIFPAARWGVEGERIEVCPASEVERPGAATVVG